MKNELYELVWLKSTNDLPEDTDEEIQYVMIVMGDDPHTGIAFSDVCDYDGLKENIGKHDGAVYYFKRNR